MTNLTRSNFQAHPFHLFSHSHSHQYKIQTGYTLHYNGNTKNIVYYNNIPGLKTGIQFCNTK